MRRAPAVTWIVLWLAALLGVVACGDGEEPAVEPPGAGEETTGESASASPARYLSAFAFTGTVRGSSRLYLELVHRTTETTLARDYRGWLAEGDGGWRPFLRLRDTLPVSRAGWRIVPGGGLSLRVGDGARILSLSHRDSALALRLRPERILAEWTGPTGQREYLALATLERDSLSQPGLLHFRRVVRTATAPADRTADRLLLLGDARGNGWLVALPEATEATEEAGETEAGTGGFAWGWLDGARARWSGARLRREGSASWSLAIPSAGIAVELEAAAGAGPLEGSVGSDSRDTSGVEARSDLAAPPSVILVRGTLEAPDAQRRAVRGLLLSGRLP